jgi:hypothetical protein
VATGGFSPKRLAHAQPSNTRAAPWGLSITRAAQCFCENCCRSRRRSRRPGEGAAIMVLALADLGLAP